MVLAWKVFCPSVTALQGSLPCSSEPGLNGYQRESQCLSLVQHSQHRVKIMISQRGTPRWVCSEPATMTVFYLTALGRFVSIAAVLLGGVLASHELFLQLLRNVMRSPMVFFEQTPVGNLLNRFSREMDAIDSVIPDKLKSLLGFLFHLLEICLVILVATPRAAMAIVPLTVLYAAFQVGPHGSTGSRGWSSVAVSLQKASFVFLGHLQKLVSSSGMYLNKEMSVALPTSPQPSRALQRPHKEASAFLMSDPT